MSLSPALGLGPERKRQQALAGAFGGVALVCGLLSPVAAAYAQGAPPVALIRDTEIEATLHADCDPIFAAAGLDPKGVKIFIVQDNDINAFSAGGQNVFINTGLIAKTANPNELIGVVAHETGHIAGGHLIRGEAGEKQALATYLLTMGLGILAAVAGAPDVAGGLLYSSGYFAAITAASFTRTQESSADQAAVTYLEKSGQSAKGLVDFFNNFRYEEVFSDARRYRFFVDHPLSEDRIEALQRRAESQPHFNVVDSPEAIQRHQVMIAKLKSFVNQPAQTYYDYPPSDQSFPARYARAIADYRDLETDKALKETDALIADQPNNPYLYELKGQIYFESGRAKEAEPAHRRAVELAPNAALLHINLGQALLAEDDPAKVSEAISELRKATDEEPDNAFAWLNLAQAYDREGKSGMARLAAAEQNFSMGQLGDAKMFAMRARMQLTRNTPDWRRATDIVLASNPSSDDLRTLSQEGSVPSTAKR
jgi:predicted Zn-dependent protease